MEKDREREGMPEEQQRERSDRCVPPAPPAGSHSRTLQNRHGKKTESWAVYREGIKEGVRVG